MTAVIKEINYRIEFFSFWHCGSGLAAGADLDERVIRDHDNLPFQDAQLRECSGMRQKLFTASVNIQGMNTS